MSTASPTGWSHCKLEYLLGGQGQQPQAPRGDRKNPPEFVDLHCTACTEHMFSTEDSTLYMGVTYLSMPYTKSTSSSTTSGLTSAKITCLSFRGSRPRPPNIGNFKASSKLWTGWRRPLPSSRTASACEVTFMHSQILTWSELVVWLEQLMKYTWLLSLCNFSTLLINHALFRIFILYERVTKIIAHTLSLTKNYSRVWNYALFKVMITFRIMKFQQLNWNIKLQKIDC